MDSIGSQTMLTNVFWHRGFQGNQFLHNNQPRQESALWNEEKHFTSNANPIIKDTQSYIIQQMPVLQGWFKNKHELFIRTQTFCFFPDVINIKNNQFVVLSARNNQQLIERIQAPLIKCSLTFSLRSHCKPYCSIHSCSHCLFLKHVASIRCQCEPVMALM